MSNSIFLQNQYFNSKSSLWLLSLFGSNYLTPLDANYPWVYFKYLQAFVAGNSELTKVDLAANNHKNGPSQNYGPKDIDFLNKLHISKGHLSLESPSVISFGSELFSRYLAMNTIEFEPQDKEKYAKLALNIQRSHFLSSKMGFLRGLFGKEKLINSNMQSIALSDVIEQIQEPKNRSSEIRNWLTSFAAGFFAGTVARTSTAPFDRLKFIYMLYYKGSEKPPSILSGFKEIYKREGFKGLFKGNLVCILKASPESSIRLTVFEKLKSLIRDENTPNLDKKKLFFAGGLSGAMANLAIFPMDVLRTRLAADKNQAYTGMIDAIKKISKTEGAIRPFYKGASAAVVANLPTSGLNLMLYESLKEVVYKDSKKPSILAYMGVAGTSALVTCSLMFPLQLVASRMIMRSVLDKKNDKKGMMHQIKSIYSSEGARGFYKGYCPGTSKVILGNAMLFGCYELMKKTFGIEFRKH